MAVAFRGHGRWLGFTAKLLARSSPGISMKSKESDVEKALTAYLRFALPREAVSFHIPNGGYKLSVGELARLKAAGYTAGVPDRCVLWGGRAYWFETKGPKGRISEVQAAMFERFAVSGHHVHVVRSVEDMEMALIDAGIPINVRLL